MHSVSQTTEFLSPNSMERSGPSCTCSHWVCRSVYRTWALRGKSHGSLDRTVSHTRCPKSLRAGTCPLPHSGSLKYPSLSPLCRWGTWGQWRQDKAHPVPNLVAFLLWCLVPPNPTTVSPPPICLIFLSPSLQVRGRSFKKIIAKEYRVLLDIQNVGSLWSNRIPWCTTVLFLSRGGGVRHGPSGRCKDKKTPQIEPWCTVARLKYSASRLWKEDRPVLLLYYSIP